MKGSFSLCRNWYSCSVFLAAFGFPDVQLSKTSFPLKVENKPNWASEKSWISRLFPKLFLWSLVPCHFPWASFDVIGVQCVVWQSKEGSYPRPFPCTDLDCAHYSSIELKSSAWTLIDIMGIYLIEMIFFSNKASQVQHNSTADNTFIWHLTGFNH